MGRLPYSGTVRNGTVRNGTVSPPNPDWLRDADGYFPGLVEDLLMVVLPAYGINARGLPWEGPLMVVGGGGGGYPILSYPIQIELQNGEAVKTSAVPSPSLSPSPSPPPVKEEGANGPVPFTVVKSTYSERTSPIDTGTATGKNIGTKRPLEVSPDGDEAAPPATRPKLDNSDLVTVRLQ